VKGRKRHLLVDTQGLVLQVLVHAAGLADRDGGQHLLEACQAASPIPLAERYPRLHHLWVDAGSRGRFVAWVKAPLGWSVEVVQHWWTGVAKVGVAPGQEPPEKPRGFPVLKWRWIVERTFAWLDGYRRLSKDYAYLPETSEAMVYPAMSRLMLARLAAMAP
jgi:transposase